MKGKLGELFVSLDDIQRRRLNQFVQSPFFNRHPKVILLFEVLNKHKNGQLKKVTDLLIHSHLFPAEDYDQSKLNHFKNYLVRVIEEFITWEAASGSPVDQSLDLAKGFVQFGLDNFAGRQIKKTKNKLTASPYRDEAFYRLQYEINLRDFELQIVSGKRNRDFNLQGLTDSLDISFIAEKLKMACILQAHQTVAKQEYDTGLLNFLLSFLQDHPFLKEPTIRIYYHGYKTSTEPENLEDLDKLIESIDTYAGLFQNSDLRNIYLMAINGCIRRLNKGHKHYVRKVFDLYRSGLERKVLFENGLLTTWTYKNVASAGMRLKEFDWVKSFIYEYKAFLPEADQEPYFHFNLAKFYFEQKDFYKAMPLLSQEEYADLLTNLAAKIMLVKMYYEQGEFEPLSSLLASIKKYIYRKKVLGYHKEHYLSIIGFLQKMLDTPRSDKASWRELREELSKSTVSEKEWLLAQIERSL